MRRWRERERRRVGGFCVFSQRKERRERRERRGSGFFPLSIFVKFQFFLFFVFRFFFCCSERERERDFSFPPSPRSLFPDSDHCQASVILSRHQENGEEDRIRSQREREQAGETAMTNTAASGDDRGERRGGGKDSLPFAEAAAPPAPGTDRGTGQASTSGAFIIHKVKKGG